MAGLTRLPLGPDWRYARRGVESGFRPPNPIERGWWLPVAVVLLFALVSADAPPFSLFAGGLGLAFVYWQIRKEESMTAWRELLRLVIAESGLVGLEPTELRDLSVEEQLEIGVVSRSLRGSCARLGAIEHRLDYDHSHYSNTTGAIYRESDLTELERRLRTIRQTLGGVADGLAIPEPGSVGEDPLRGSHV